MQSTPKSALEWVSPVIIKLALSARSGGLSSRSRYYWKFSGSESHTERRQSRQFPAKRLTERRHGHTKRHNFQRVYTMQRRSSFNYVLRCTLAVPCLLCSGVSGVCVPIFELETLVQRISSCPEHVRDALRIGCDVLFWLSFLSEGCCDLTHLWDLTFKRVEQQDDYFMVVIQDIQNACMFKRVTR